MRKYLAVILALLLVFSFGCSSAKGDVKSYLPKIGDVQTFSIQIGKALPLDFYEVVWPMGGTRGMVYGTRGYISPKLLEDRTLKSGNLVILVGPSTVDDCFHLGNPMMLTVQSDPLEIMGNGVKSVLIGTDKSTDVSIEHIYSKDSAFVPGGPIGVPFTSDGCSIRPYMFLIPGNSRSITISKQQTENPVDETTDVGIENGLLHMRRVVLPDTHSLGPSDYIDSGFTEDYLFAPGRGLVSLTQTVNGIVSMVWTRQ